MTVPILSLKNVNKSFGPIEVLYDINLEVHAGEVLCLLGDNGAGKSTLIKILSGVYELSSGRLEMDGKEVTFTGPRHASEMGIATVHQFGGTFPLMSIGRSFFVGAEPTKGWGPFKFFDRKKANKIAVDLSGALASHELMMAIGSLVDFLVGSGNLLQSRALFISVRVS